FKPGIYKAMETEGYMSPEGMLVQPKQEATSVEYITADDGEMMALTTYPDGTIVPEHTGIYPMLEPVEGPDVGDMVNLEELGMKQEAHAERYRADIIKILGDLPRIGIDFVEDAEGNKVPAGPEHVNAWLEGYGLLNA
ncbi:unnamed protein product, partial [marine sediment metagenome]